MKIALFKLFTFGSFLILACSLEVSAQNAPSGSPPVSQTPEVCLSPKGPLRDGVPVDYWDLFQPNAVWSSGVPVNVFGTSAYVISQAPQDKLIQAFQYLKEHHIKLAVGILALKGFGSKGKEGPGYGVEGFSANPEGEATLVAKRVKSLGGVIDYVGLDEPLWFGHYYFRKNACHWPIADVLKQTVSSVKAVKAIFPDAKVVDAIPLQAMPDATWQADLQEWFAGMQAGLGEPIECLEVDVQWHEPHWGDKIAALEDLLAKSNIAFGMIFNGMGYGRSDARWMLLGEEHIQLYNHLPGIPRPPDQVSITSWDKFPMHILPDSSPTALTYLLRYYFSPEAKKTPPFAFKRLSKTGSGSFYTADPDEISSHEAQGWSLDRGAGAKKPVPGWPGEILGGIYWKNADGAQGLVPLDRLFRSSKGSYAYATNMADEQKLVDAGYARESVAGYVFSSGDSGGYPLHGLYNESSDEYCYVTNDTEYQDLLKTGWADQGIVGYLPPGWPP